jgi:hypothetical protein
MTMGTHMFDGNFEAINLQIEKLRKGFVDVAERILKNGMSHFKVVK